MSGSTLLKCCCLSGCPCCTESQFKATVLITFSGITFTCYSNGTDSWAISPNNANKANCLTYTTGCIWDKSVGTPTGWTFTYHGGVTNCTGGVVSTSDGLFEQINLRCVDAETNQWCLFASITSTESEDEGLYFRSLSFTMICGTTTTVSNDLPAVTTNGVTTDCEGTTVNVYGIGGTATIEFGAC